MIRHLLSAVLATLPAMLVASAVFMCFEEDAYYTRPWQVASIVFLAASFLLGLRCLARRTEQPDSISTIRQRFIVYPFLAWMLAVLVLFGLSFTPMVLGQDNGDGANGYAECVFFAVSSSIVYSGMALLIILLNSMLLAPLLRVVSVKMLR